MLSMWDEKSNETDSIHTQNVEEDWGFWAKAEISEHRVRSRDYLETAKKTSSEPLLFELLHVDAFIGDQPLVHLASRDFSWYFKNKLQLGTKGFTFIYSIRVNSIGCSLVSYHHIPDRSNLPKLFLDFLSKGDEFRKNRLKMIPKITKGPWLLAKTVPVVPVIVGNKVDVTYYQGEDYIECDMLCDTSSMASSIIKAARPLAKKVVTEIVWLVEAREGELPERLAIGVKFGHLDFKNFTKVIFDEQKEPIAIDDGTERSSINTDRSSMYSL